jgi:ribosomal protein S18 acetylase RimI-like enzyme
LVVREEAEGCGVGRALVEACAHWARQQGYALLVLQTGVTNTRARAFYERLGFLEEDIRLTKPL